MTKYRKDAVSIGKSVAEKATPVAEQKTGSDYNPETWTEQFFREKREAEEEIRKSEFSDGEKSEGEKNGKGIPAEKGIPGEV